MTIEYFKKHIPEEIDGAIDYMEHAVEERGTACGQTFYEMANQELNHANKLYHMMSKTEKPITMSDADYSAAMKTVLDKYSTGMTRIEALKKMFIGI